MQNVEELGNYEKRKQNQGGHPNSPQRAKVDVYACAAKKLLLWNVMWTSFSTAVTKILRFLDICRAGILKNSLQSTFSKILLEEENRALQLVKRICIQK